MIDNKFNEFYIGDKTIPKNKYTQEFAKIYQIIMTTMYDYIKNINTSPLDEETEQYYFVKVSESENDREYLKTLNEFLTLFHHPYLKLVSEEEDKEIYSIKINYLKGKYYISFALDQNIVLEEIKKINDIDINEYIKNLPNVSYNSNNNPYVSSFTIINQNKPLVLTLANGEIIEIDDIITEKELLKFQMQEVKIDDKLHKLNNNISYKIMGDTAYIRIKSLDKKNLAYDTQNRFLGDETGLKVLADNFQKADIKNLIIDLRGSTGFSSEYLTLLSYFSNQNFATSDKFINYINPIIPDDVTIPYSLDYLSKELATSTPEINSKTLSIPNLNSSIENRYLLIDNDTTLAADKIAKVCNKTGFAITIGTPTGGFGTGNYPILVSSEILSKNKKHLLLPISGSLEPKDFTLPDVIVPNTTLNPFAYGNSNTDVMLNTLIDIINLKEFKNANNEEKIQLIDNIFDYQNSNLENQNKQTNLDKQGGTK